MKLATLLCLALGALSLAAPLTTRNPEPLPQRRPGVLRREPEPAPLARRPMPHKREIGFPSGVANSGIIRREPEPEPAPQKRPGVLKREPEPEPVPQKRRAVLKREPEPQPEALWVVSGVRKEK
ncbi:hypothetical protein B0T14DRAFT_493441 [Immersiella caudata]|uniref:Apidaecin n=1 Tax=Immersiella caudata TaxID=314043 RepID=A0AA40C7C6_9PEZI|nr:hypothetical protein B0T14DRAFT_493441 [Immersiella caudata]